MASYAPQNVVTQCMPSGTKWADIHGAARTDAPVAYASGDLVYVDMKDIISGYYPLLDDHTEQTYVEGGVDGRIVFAKTGVMSVHVPPPLMNAFAPDDTTKRTCAILFKLAGADDMYQCRVGPPL